MLVGAGNYFDEPMACVCDGRCEKAWGMNDRPKISVGAGEDDWAYWADDELPTAPEYPGSSEGGQCKPTSHLERMRSKWCWRQCERSRIHKPGERVCIPDFSRRMYNLKTRHS